MDYWIKRNLSTSKKLTEKTEKEVQKQLVRYYRKAANHVIMSFVETYEKVLEALQQGREPTPADLYKLDSYWQMQNQLKDEIQKLGEHTYNAFFKGFTDEYINVYNGLAIPSQSTFSSIDRRNAEQIIKQIWCADGKSWSSRIWKNCDKLQQTLNDSLLECVVNGKPMIKLRQQLMADFDVNYRQAHRIAITELSHIQTQAAQKRYQDYGITEVQVWADEDEKRCEQCAKLHLQKFPINGKMPVPVHPSCRCNIIPVVETKFKREEG